MYRQGGDSDIGPLSNMKIDHLLQVHAVGMVGTEDGDDVEVTILYQVDILVNGVCRAPVPAVSRALLRRNRKNEVVTQDGTEPHKLVTRDVRRP